MTLAELDALLLVQERDLAIDQLRHRRASLPERDELVARRGDEATLSAELAAVTAERDDVQREEKRLDDEAQTVSAKAADVDRKLYSGTVTSPKELQALQADLDALKTHRSEIEDRELDVMERREELDARIADLEARIAPVRTAIADLGAAIAQAEADIDAQVAAQQAERAGLAAAIAPTLLADYERRRASNRGVGAARLVGPTCQACRLTIPSTELDVIRRDPEAAIYTCDNCGAILVPAV